MAARLGAWLIDSMILGGFQIGFWMVALGMGAVSINPEAEQQLRAAPFSLTTVPPYQADLLLLAALLAAFVVLNVAYAAVCWARLRGLPGQRLTSLQVGSAATGHNLSLGRALLRAVVAVGIPVAAVAVLVYAAMVIETTVPWSEVVDASAGGTADARLSAWSVVVGIAMLAAIAWPSLLLLSTAASPMRQGLHDRLAGSLVVGKGRSPWAGSVYGPVYGPLFGPGYPGYGSPGVPPAGGRPPAGLPLGVAPPGVSEGAPAGVAAADESSPSTSGPADEGQAEPGAPAGPPTQAGMPGAPDDGSQVPPQVGQAPWTGPGASTSQPWAGPGPAPGAGEGPAWIPSDYGDGVPKPRAATVGRRVAAYLFDCVIVYMVFVLIQTIVAVALLPADTTTLDERTYILIGLVGGFWQLAYFTSGWAVWRGTLGQKLMHMQVTEATTGKALGWLDSMVRWAVLQGPFALVTIVPEAARLLVLMAASTWVMYLLYTTSNARDIRGLHDRFLNSKVTVEF